MPAISTVASKLNSFGIAITSSDPAAFDAALGGWRQKIPLGTSQVTIAFDVTNRTTSPSNGLVFAALDGVPLNGGKGVAVSVGAGAVAHGTLSMVGGAKAGAHTLSIKYALAAAVAVNPSLGISGARGSPIPIYKTLASAFYPFVGEQIVILDTEMNNDPRDTSDHDWTCIFVTGKPNGDDQYLANTNPKLEWLPIRNPGNQLDDTTVIAGTVGHSQRSGGDLPFTHPFFAPGDTGGYDYEFYLGCDPRFVQPPNSLLSSTNNDDSEHQAAIAFLGTHGVPVPDRGVMGVEVDSSFVTPNYQVHPGDRVVMLGRWIADGGHPPYQTEIHPPLLLVSARPDPAAPADRTISKISARPYLVNQLFDGGSLRDKLIAEVAKVAAGLSDQPVVRTELFPMPFEGIKVLAYVVRPPTGRTSPAQILTVSYHFTVRSGVAVLVYDAGQDTVGVVVVLNDAGYVSPQLPPHTNRTLTLDEIDALAPGKDIKKTVLEIIRGSELATGAALAGAPVLDLLGLLVGIPPGTLSIAAASAGADASRTLNTILRNGILVDRYDLASPPAIAASDLTTVPLSRVGGGPHFIVDDSQPCPVFGELRASWRNPANITKAKSQVPPVSPKTIHPPKTRTTARPR